MGTMYNNIYRYIDGSFILISGQPFIRGDSRVVLSTGQSCMRCAWCPNFSLNQGFVYKAVMKQNSLFPLKWLRNRIWISFTSWLVFYFLVAAKGCAIHEKAPCWSIKTLLNMTPKHVHRTSCGAVYPTSLQTKGAKLKWDALNETAWKAVFFWGG